MDHGGIAQLVERLVRNEKARGSNPLTSSPKSFLGCRAVALVDGHSSLRVVNRFSDWRQTRVQRPRMRAPCITCNWCERRLRLCAEYFWDRLIVSAESVVSLSSTSLQISLRKIRNTIMISA